MTKEMLTVLLVVVGLSALMGTANAAVAQDAVPNAVSDDAIGLINATGVEPQIRFDENGRDVLPPGLFIEAENGTLVELTASPEDDEMVEDAEDEIETYVFFNLYTRKNPTTSQTIVPRNKIGLRDTNWDVSKPTRIVIHGWQSSGTARACTLPRDAYLQHGDYNVIVVDWYYIARWTYGYSSKHVPTVARYVARLIDFLEEEGMNLSQLVISGHSLGGHVAGLSARWAHGTVGNVVALDPAGPYFRAAGPGERVDKTDAANVHVIHTNAGYYVALGLAENVGHVDFYPNGGGSQPGCTLETCSHSRSYELFAESINSQVGFDGKRCRVPTQLGAEICQGPITARMGGSPPIWGPAVEGSFYLETASISPFAKAA